MIEVGQHGTPSPHKPLIRENAVLGVGHPWDSAVMPP